MKNFFKPLLIILFLLTGAYAVWYAAPSANNPYTYITKNESIESKYLSAKISYPQIRGLEDSSIQDEINQKLAKAVGAPLSTSTASSEAPLEDCDSSATGCVIDSQSNITVSELTNKYLSAVIGSYEYYPGANHPNHSGSSLNFDLQTGMELKLSDFFKPNSNYLTAISGKLRDDLAKQLSVPITGYQLVEGTQPDGEHFLNFVLTEKGFLFLFSDYEVAPYAAGNPSSLILYSELTNILNPAFLLQIRTFTPSTLVN